MERNKSQILAERLANHPEIEGRVEEILEIIDNTKGEANTADEAEERAVQELRQLGRELLEAWAKKKEEKLEKEYDTRQEYRRKGKKK
jgi:hypothetical protein